MRTIYYLKTCDTCRRILKELNPGENVRLREIKSDPITAEELDEIYSKVGSYRPLLNKRARLLREWDVDYENADEATLRKWILKEYTLLARPVFVLGDEVFIGNAAKTVEAVKERL